jgi:hypothetical protein
MFCYVYTIHDTLFGRAMQGVDLICYDLRWDIEGLQHTRVYIEGLRS